MSKEELSSLREEIFKEIHNVENNMNLKVLKHFQENEDNNKIFIEKFNSLYHKSQTLSDSISSQVVNLDKIKEFDNFRNKIDNIIITHEIRINNNREDIKNMEFKYDKEISENLKVPGFVGPSCKFKNISNYLSFNIDEVSKLKNENESFKKEIKDIKKKLDEIIRTVLNLVDNTNIKMVQYVDTKSKIINQMMDERFKEMSDKIVDFKSLLLTQKNAEDLQAHLIKEMQNNNYTKEEVDNKLNDIVKNFGANFEDFKINCEKDYNILIKKSTEKFDKDNNEINKSIKEIKQKIKQLSEKNMRFVQRERMKTNIYNSKGNLINNNSNANNIFSQNSENHNNAPKIKIKEEENKIIYRNTGHRKSIDLTNDLKYINNFENKINELKGDQEKKNSIILNNENINMKEAISSENSPRFKTKFFSNSSLIKVKEKNEIGLIFLKSEENKNTISKGDSDNENGNKNGNDNGNVVEEFNLSINPNNASNSKIGVIEKENFNNNKINNNVLSPNPYNMKSKSLINNKANKSENKNRNHLLLLKSENKKTKNNESKNNKDTIEEMKNIKLQNHSKSKKNVSDFLSFGMNNQNQKSILVSLENEKTHKYNNNPIVETMKENNYIKNNLNDKINSINTKNIKPQKGLSIHQLANIGFEEREKKIFSSIGSLSPRSSSRKNKHNKTITPIIKNIFKQTIQTNTKNSKILQDISSEVPIKINQAFGRTGYSYYDKKEEGINNLIDKGISNKMKSFNNKSSDFRFKLYPAAKIKVFSEM